MGKNKDGDSKEQINKKTEENISMITVWLLQVRFTNPSARAGYDTESIF